MKNFPGIRIAILSIGLPTLGLSTVVNCGAPTGSEAAVPQAKLEKPQVKDKDPAINVVKLWGQNEAGLTKALGKPKSRVVTKNQDVDAVTLTFGPAKGFLRTSFGLRESPFNAVRGFRGKTVCEFTGVLKDYVPSKSAPTFAGFNPVPKENVYGGATENRTKIIGFDMAWPGSKMSLYYFEVDKVDTPSKGDPLALKKGERVLSMGSD